jgi:Phytanoyl-CoA dioxygenase (PhyH)
VTLKLKKRQREAMEAVSESLKKKNYAIVHRDDLFGKDEMESWDAAEEWMERFASSKEAMDFEQAFFDHVHANIAYDRREKEELDLLGAETAKRNKAYEDARAEMEAAKAAGDKTRIPAAINAFKAASAAFKEISSKRYLAIKRFAIERKLKNTKFKPYVFTHVGWLGRSIKYSDPPIMLSASHRLLAIADAYHGEKAKMRIPTVWRVSAMPKGAELPARQGSQLWHRDQTDPKILKLFIYYTDVDEKSGALEYIPGSLPQNSKWSEKIPLLTTTGYPPQELVAKLVPKRSIVKCEGKRGTLIFVDTAGLHRGGYATDGHRVTVQATYLRPNHVHPQSPLLPEGVADPSLTPEQLYALS